VAEGKRVRIEMAEPSLHFSLPFAIFSYLGFSLPFCIFSSIFALVPDFDVLFKRHRSITHSFLIYVPILILALVLHPFNGKMSEFLVAAWFALSSNVFLDLLVGYTPALWPIVRDEMSVSVEASVRFGRSFLVVPRLEIKKRKFLAESFDELEATMVTSQGLLISLLLILLSLLRFIR